MNWSLATELEKFNFDISHSTQVVLMGSCFSDEMTSKFQGVGFRTLSNPFGTLFHPTAIANAILKAISDDSSVDVYNRDDLFFSWDASSFVYAKTEEELRKLVNEKRKSLRNALLDDALLVVTFGTAWQYEHRDLGMVVGNCHKAESSVFIRTLTATSDLIEIWKDAVSKLRVFNPKLKLVFTVSPVRHKKDGLIQNNRSKSRLIELAHNLVDDEVKYFPSYEIVIDELRDYRFYSSDLVHPNSIAVDEVWNRLESVLLGEDRLPLFKKVRSIKTMLAHKSLHPDSSADKARIEKAMKLKEELSLEYPQISW